MASCSSPESVAEKALQEIGNGKYKTGSYSITSAKYSLDDDLFTLALLDNKYGEEFTKYGGVSGTVPSLGVLLDTYFDTDILFDSFKLVDKKSSTIDIYGFARKDDYGEDDIFQIMKETYSKRWKDFRCNDYVMAGLEYKNVPRYDLRYKADNTYIIDVTVLKIPSEGYKVASVTMQ